MNRFELYEVTFGPFSINDFRINNKIVDFDSPKGFEYISGCGFPRYIKQRNSYQYEVYLVPKGCSVLD